MALHRTWPMQEVVVDLWAAMEQQTLHYLRRNQSKLRVASYASVREAAAAGAGAGSIGTPIVLPSSHVGGDRYMQQLY